MKKLLLGAATAGALLTAAAVPAMAQVGFYAGPGGVGIDIGTPGYYGYYAYPHRYYDYYGYGGRPYYWHHHGWEHHHWHHY